MKRLFVDYLCLHGNYDGACGLCETEYQQYQSSSGTPTED